MLLLGKVEARILWYSRRPGQVATGHTPVCPDSWAEAFSPPSGAMVSGSANKKLLANACSSWSVLLVYRWARLTESAVPMLLSGVSWGPEEDLMRVPVQTCAFQTNAHHSTPHSPDTVTLFFSLSIFWSLSSASAPIKPKQVSLSHSDSHILWFLWWHVYIFH